MMRILCTVDTMRIILDHMSVRNIFNLSLTCKAAFDRWIVSWSRDTDWIIPDWSEDSMNLMRTVFRYVPRSIEYPVRISVEGYTGFHGYSTARIMNFAAMHGYLDILDWLYHATWERITWKAVKFSHDAEVLNWIRSHYLMPDDERNDEEMELIPASAADCIRKSHSTEFRFAQQRSEAKVFAKCTLVTIPWQETNRLEQHEELIVLPMFHGRCSLSHVFEKKKSPQLLSSDIDRYAGESYGKPVNYVNGYANTYDFF
jgi:hypothetical protein